MQLNQYGKAQWQMAWILQLGKSAREYRIDEIGVMRRVTARQYSAFCRGADSSGFCLLTGDSRGMGSSVFYG